MLKWSRGVKLHDLDGHTNGTFLEINFNIKMFVNVLLEIEGLSASISSISEKKVS